MTEKYIKAAISSKLEEILKTNAPVRDGVKYPGARGASPFPGNLRKHGIVAIKTNDSITVQVGGEEAPYAIYTETRSRRKGWQQKSANEFVQYLKSIGGVVTNG